jgi:CopG family transcriptional regulator, nickel-responsive regulator
VKDVLMRFSVAIGSELLRRFDIYCEKHRYPNRSEAVRGLIRAALIEEAVDEETSDAMGVVTLIYDHHAGRVAERLTEIQHEHIHAVVTTTHVHLDARRCLEVILLRGRTQIVRKLADDLIGTKGVETGRLVLASASSILQDGHEHRHDHSRPHPHGDHDHDHGHGHSHD